MTADGLAARLLLPTATLAAREWQRFIRQRSRIIGAFGTPILFWVLIGSGLGRSFSTQAIAGGASYLEYFFPGVIAMIVLFTAIFSMFSVIEDRHAGFLQAVLVSPASRVSIALGKIIGCTALATVQAGLFLALAPASGLQLGAAQVSATLGITVLLGFALSGLGFVAAWAIDSTQGFHAIMNLVLMPMWVLSGAVFPAEGASRWMQGVLAVNPLTYGVAAIRRALYPPEAIVAGHVPSLATCVLVTSIFGVGTLLGSTWLVQSHRGANA